MMGDAKPRQRPAGSGKRKASNLRYGLIFLAACIALWIVAFLMSPDKAREALDYSWKITLQIIPVLLLVIAFMAVVNYLLTPSMISRHVGRESGARGWIVSSVAGLLSHGPIYVWYPLLSDLKERGMKDGLVAVFLYNRAVKLPLIPIMVHYFGAVFVAVLLAVMIIGSIGEGLIVDMVMGE